MAGRIKLLFLASTPSETSRTRVGAEAAHIREALERCADRRFELVDRHAVRIDQVQPLVVSTAAQVVHFAGHGLDTGALVFEDNDGHARPANPAAITRLFELAGHNARLVVLNACYSHEQAEAIAEHIDAVIGMTAAVPDRTAIAFSAELYANLARGCSVGRAFKLAKNQVALQNLPGDHMPQLVTRSGVDPDAVFLRGRAAPRRPAPPAPDRPATGGLLEQIRGLVADDRLGDALDALGGGEGALSSQQQDELALLQRQWGQLERDDLEGAERSALEPTRHALAVALLRLARELDQPSTHRPNRALEASELRHRKKYLQATRLSVVNLLRESIHNARFLDLGIADSPIATHLPWVYKNPDSKRELASIEEAFQLYDRRLLLLGAPGAGKTVTLLHLGLALLDEADRDASAPIPLIVNLSKYRFEPETPSLPTRLLGRHTEQAPDRSFQWWLAGELAERGVPRAVAQRWLEEGRIAAFLDGLDEVNDVRRAELALLLNQTFLDEHRDIVVVIASRIADYQPLQGRMETRIWLTGAITLQPLAPAQIDVYLETAGASGLREALGRDDSLRELAETPLTLSMMSLAYGGTSAASIPSLPRLADQRHHLMESFVARMLQRKERRDRGIQFDDDKDKDIPAASYRYHPDKVNRYLSWLAIRMSIRTQTSCALQKFFGFLALCEAVEEIGTAAWVIVLSQTAMFLALIAVVATSLAPGTRNGFFEGVALALAGGCLCALAIARRGQRPAEFSRVKDDSDFVLAGLFGLTWLAAVSHSWVALRPGAPELALGFLLLSGLVSLGAAAVAVVVDEPRGWWIVAGGAAGALTGAAILGLEITSWPPATVMAIGIVLGLMVAIGILLYRTARDRGIAIALVILSFFVLGAILGIEALLLWIGGAFSWHVAQGLVTLSALVIIWRLKRPSAALCGLILVVAGGTFLGGKDIGLIGGGIWGIALLMLMLLASKSGPWENALDYINSRVEPTVDRWLLTPTARALLALPRVLPWRLHDFLRYSGGALLLKPFTGELEFVHRRLRDHFALRDLVPRLKELDLHRRIEVIRAIGFQGVAAIDILREVLADGRAEERVAAVHALGRISAAEIAGYMRTALMDPCVEVRRAVVLNLRNLRADDAEAMLFAAVRDPDLKVIKAVIDVVGAPGRSGSYSLRTRSNRLTAMLIRRVVVSNEQIHELLREVAASASYELAEQIPSSVPASARGIVGRLLTDANSRVRTQVCQWMVKNPAIADVDTLARVLREDRYLAVREQAANALATAPPDNALDPLVAALSDRHPDIRAAAVRAIGDRQDERALEALLRASSDRSTAVRCAALGALSRLQSPRAVERLREALRDRRVARRREAAVATADARRGVVGSFIDFHVHAARRVGRDAAKSPGGFGEPGLVQPLILALADEDAQVRRSAAASLGSFQDKRAVAPLIRLLGDDDRVVRSAAATSLGELGDIRAVERLIDAGRDKDITVRTSAVASLGLLGDPRAVEHLIRALDDRDEGVRLRAANGLRSLADTRAVAPLVRALQDPSFEVQSAAADGLIALEDPSVIPHLLQLETKSVFARQVLDVLKAFDALTTADVELRHAAVASASASSDRRLIAFFIRALSDGAAGVREAAAFRLRNIHDRRALRPLLGAIADPSPGVRRAVAEALGAQTSLDATEALRRAFQDESADVRLGAALSLCARGNLEAEEHVLDVLGSWSDADHVDRVADWNRLVGSLGRTGSARVLAALREQLSSGDAWRRQAVVDALVGECSLTDRVLLSVACDGEPAWTDPLEPITVQRVELCASRLQISPEAVRARYEALAPEFGLRLAWSNRRPSS